MGIKKQFQDLINLLQENPDKKVKNILDDAVALASTKGRGSSVTTVHMDDKGNVIAILDYYFKQWMPLSHVEFGLKPSASTGYNQMSKEGALNHSRQQTVARKATAQLLEDAIAGTISQDKMGKIREEIEATRTSITAHSAGIGFETIDELLAADPAELDALVEAVSPEPAEGADAEAVEETTESTDTDVDVETVAEEQAQAA